MWLNKDECYGLHDQNNKTIELSTSCVHKNMVETFLHEILHAIYTEYEISSQDDEEKTVSLMSKGLLNTLVDNPDLIDYLVKTLKPTEGTKQCEQ